MVSSYYSTANTVAVTYIIVSLVVAVTVCILLGAATKHINESKGYTGGFAWGFWLGIIGIVVVACKADNRGYTAYEAPRYAGQSSSASSRDKDALLYCLRQERPDMFPEQGIVRFESFMESNG